MNYKNKELSIGVRPSGGFREESIHPEMSEDVPDLLEEIEKQIYKLKDKTWEIAWLIGKRLIKIKEKQLLKNTKYTTLDDYIEDKFEFSRRSAYNFIYLAHNFNKVHTSAHGYKLVLLQPLEDLKRQKYLKWIDKENPSANDIREKIKSENKKLSMPKREISLSKIKMTVDFKKMGVEIEKEKEKEFLKKLEALIREYSKEEKN
ncbi:MAG: hypothetical protein OEV44_14905 [Spirochaetota bacterium]|nr:hypothetical protein [Spirochaetota bacterium]